MSSKWGNLSKDTSLLQRFEVDLREHLAKDYEVDDELVKFVIGSVKEVKDKIQLAAEFKETFEDDAVNVSTWCWDKLLELSEQPSAVHAATAESGLPDDLSEEGELAADQPEDGLHEGQQLSKKSKREPIKFNLESAAADTAPIKASSHKLQQMRPQKAASMPSPSESQQQSKQQQEPRTTTSQPEAARGAAAAVKGALAAAVRSTAAEGTRGSRSLPAGAAVVPRGRGRHRERTPPVEPAAATVTSPRVQAAHGPTEQPGDSSRAPGRDREPPARVAGAKRSLGDAAAAGPRNIAHMALRAITGSIGGRAPKRQQQQQTAGRSKQPMESKQRVQQEQQQQQQQQQRDEQQQYDEPRAGRVSVLDRLGSKDSQGDGQKGSNKHSVFERLSGLAPSAVEAQAPGGIADDKAADAAAAESPARKAQHTAADAVPQQPKPRLDQQQQQQQVGGVLTDGTGSRRSVVHRLVGSRSVAAEEHQQPEQQEQEQRPPKQSVATDAATATVQRSTAEPAAQRQAEPAAAPGSKRKAAAAASANGGPTAAGAAAKRLATAAAPSAKPQPSSELAALRAQLAAKEAEVKRLQQIKALQEVDERSVVVYNIAPHVPEAVVRAHFSGCGPIKRCTLLPGRMPGPHIPGAYLEFQSNTGALAAMGLAGSSMLNQQIQVARKSDYIANQQKAKQTYAALRAQAGAVAGKHWTKTTAAPNAAAPVPVGTGPAAGGDPESPTSLGSMGLFE